MLGDIYPRLEHRSIKAKNTRIRKKVLKQLEKGNSLDEKESTTMDAEYDSGEDSLISF